MSTKTKEAFKIGTKAFEEGKPCVPCLDSGLTALLGGPIGSGIPVLDAWHSGWAKANLAAPIE